MFEESMSIPSIWASMNSWFTPAVLFLLLNLMIGTIFVTSGLGTQRPHQQPRDSSQDPQPQLPRSPSVLQRLKSINFYSYRSQEPTTVTPSIAEKLPEQDTRFALRHTHQPEPEPEPEREPEPESHEGESPKTLDEIYGQIQGRPFERTKSDQEPASGETPARLSKKMKKSASAKSTFAHFEEGDIVESRRPATVREGKAKATVAEGDEDDEEVDAKADDFINKFKQQLKLQRLDSIIRYKEMIGRGTGK